MEPSQVPTNVQVKLELSSRAVSLINVFLDSKISKWNTLCTRTDGHKFDTRTQKKNKVISGHFNLPEHSVADFKITA